ncbi:hypothetical protein HMPREF0262_03694 [Clostridium sp. ATCC 29733]|nr:hypothetical protein HMPREF0262_03694 [Clostridium sp. ATCC 29733]
MAPCFSHGKSSFLNDLSGRRLPGGTGAFFSVYHIPCPVRPICRERLEILAFCAQ